MTTSGNEADDRQSVFDAILGCEFRSEPENWGVHSGMGRAEAVECLGGKGGDRGLVSFFQCAACAASRLQIGLDPPESVQAPDSDIPLGFFARRDACPHFRRCPTRCGTDRCDRNKGRGGVVLIKDCLDCLEQGGPPP